MSSAIVDRDLPYRPHQCFEFFCRVEAIPRWVPEVREVRLLDRDAEGRPVHVEYVTRPPGSEEELRYVMAYVYEAEPLAIEWFPRSGHDVAVSGHAIFGEIPGGCRLTYVLAPGRERPERDEDRRALKAQARALLERFAAELEAALTP